LIVDALLILAALEAHRTIMSLVSGHPRRACASVT
jgi:hypothetical protein